MQDGMGRTVHIHYRRLPDRMQVFEQEVVADAGAYIVTFLPAATIPKPVRVGEQIILEPGSRWCGSHIPEGAMMQGAFTERTAPSPACTPIC